MPNIHGKNCFISFEDSGGASRSMYSDGNSVTLTESVNAPDNTGFGDIASQRAASGLQDAKITFEGWANDTATTGNMVVLFGMKGYSTIVAYAPNGSPPTVGGASPDKYTACMVVDDVELRSPIDGLVVCRASFSLRSGSVTKNSGNGSWTTVL